MDEYNRLVTQIEKLREELLFSVDVPDQFGELAKLEYLQGLNHIQNGVYSLIKAGLMFAAQESDRGRK